MRGRLYTAKNSKWEYHRIHPVYPEDEEYLRKMIEEHPNLDPIIIKETWGDELFDRAYKRGEVLQVYILRDLNGNKIAQIIKDQNGEIVKGKKFDPERGVLV